MQKRATLMLQTESTGQGKLFIARDDTLSQLSGSISKGRIPVLLANSGLGRSALLKQYAKEKDAAYIDMRKLSTSPESFALGFIGRVCFLSLAKDASEWDKFQSLENLKALKLGKACSEAIAKVDNELQKIKPDQELLLKTALGFPGLLASQLKQQHSIILNNFEELLKLNKFAGIKDILKTFMGSAPCKDCSFIFGSSMANLSRSALKDVKDNIDIIELGPLPVDGTRRIFESIAGKADRRIIDETHRLSAGLPLMITDIAEHFSKVRTGDVQKDMTRIQQITTALLATTSSRSYSYCSSLFTGSLNRARGDSLLKDILKAVCQNRPMRLTEIARTIYRSGPVTKSLLERLVEVDLITRTDNTFSFSNPVLRQWCAVYFSGISFDDLPDQKMLAQAGLDKVGGAQ